MSKKCQEGCTCARHTRAKDTYRSGSTRCLPGCTCSRHTRVFTEEHRENVRRANQARQGETRPCPEGCTCGRHKGYHFGGSKQGRQLSEEARKNISTAASNRPLKKPYTKPRLPAGDDDKSKGYLYIIEFSTGVVKVGRTTSPRHRITSQLHVAQKLGAKPKNVWLSCRHEEYVLNENILLGKLGSPRDEYLDSVTFSEVVQVAESLVNRNASGFQLEATIIS